MVEAGVDFLVLDYLAEITMGLLAGARRRDASAGFVPDFIDYVIAPHARAIAQKQIKIVANAGGMNPDGCRVAVAQALEAAGVDLKIAVVTGDDLLVRHTSLRAAGVALPDNLISLNAYLGARGIAEALDLGADIVITGRCVDSALVLGPLVHKFQWSWTNYDLMAQGSLAGHLVECGCQATGGNPDGLARQPGLGAHGLSDRGMFCRRLIRAHETLRHRRLCKQGKRCGTTRL